MLHRFVQDIGVINRRRAARRQHEAGRLLVRPNQVRKAPVRLGPVEGQLGVAKASVGAERNLGEGGAEIMDVELEQVRQQRSVRLRGDLECDHRCRHWYVRSLDSVLAISCKHTAMTSDQEMMRGAFVSFNEF
jgi:hypothetical protein